MAARKTNGNGANGKAKAARGPRIVLSADIADSVEEDVVWTGQSRNSANSALREQLAEQVSEMEYGSVRRYHVPSEQQSAFLSLFRNVVEKVWDGKYGVSANQSPSSVTVKLGNKVTRTRRNKK